MGARSARFKRLGTHGALAGLGEKEDDSLATIRPAATSAAGAVHARESWGAAAANRISDCATTGLQQTSSLFRSRMASR